MFWGFRDSTLLLRTPLRHLLATMKIWIQIPLMPKIPFLELQTEQKQNKDTLSLHSERTMSFISSAWACQAVVLPSKHFFKNGPFPVSFSLFLSFQYTVDSKQMFNKFCRWLDSNRRPLVSEVTALPTEPHNHCPFFDFDTFLVIFFCGNLMCLFGALLAAQVFNVNDYSR